jgi:phosphoserine phosphatase
MQEVLQFMRDSGYKTYIVTGSNPVWHRRT